MKLLENARSPDRTDHSVTAWARARLGDKLNRLGLGARETNSDPNNLVVDSGGSATASITVAVLAN